jgi:exodeoxyribonuclease VII large subunit
MFRNSNRRVTFRPQHGQQVLVRANITLYEPRGDYQIIVESMQPAGEGLLQQKYEQLKATLSAEGFSTSSLKTAALSCPLRWGYHLKNRCGTA